ncbi:protein O-mannosyl-transferase Tmtc3-like isoform X2 [Centruroides vittatus]|uniref:protein O-mannosyl-transferase Tmtc3-like isoform X2 n=1 Tax=Centruroides vittatus TaxID=120091 RepID=UPI003510A121
MRTLLAKKAFNPQRKSQDLTFKNCLFKYKPDLEKGVKKRHYLLLVTTVCACYYNALECGFVFDDMSAVKDNKDLRPITHVSNIFWNDFWGTPIIKEHSHKSYRPICVLTFRINYMIDELNPLGYHLVNVLLHALVCILYLRLCYMFLPAESSLVAAMLFAVHPIHTEAVTGVVGRAETLSSVFFLSAFLCYIQCSQWKWTDWPFLISCLLLVVLATLSKEQGITVIGVCFIYELLILHKGRIWEVVYVGQWTSKSPLPVWLREMFLRLFALILAAVSLLIARVRLMGSQLPVFTKFDNPAAVSDTPTRQLTYNYLLPVNVWLLLFPCDLCCDWTMGTIPLVDSFLDPRNLATVALYFAISALIRSSVVSEAEGHYSVVIMSLSLMMFPFLPASNLFFPVGFVVAERVLYTPSMGFCLLVAYGWQLLYKRRWKLIVWSGVLGLLFIHTLKSVHRNSDWKSEYTIFMAGLRVNDRNAKLYNNVGHALENRGDYQKALEYFRKASEVQPDDIGAHINVGRTLNNMRMYQEAEEAFWKAKNLLPRPRPGEQYQARVAPSHLNVFLNLGNLISRNDTRLEEADSLYKQAISMRADYIQAYINRGDILVRLNRTEEAREVYKKALKFDSNNPDLYYNLGVVLLEQGRSSEALQYFDKALKLDPGHEQALMNSAILIQETGSPQLRKVAHERLNVLLQKGKASERVYFNLGMLAMDNRDVSEAEKCFRKAIELRDDFRSALFNLALLLSDAHRPFEAVPVLKQLLKNHPDHVKGLILLGDIYINHVRNLDAAKQCYEDILSLEPSNIQALHNLCVVYVERGLLLEAESCLKKAVSIAPHEEYVQRHLKIVKDRLKQQEDKQSLNGRNSSYSSKFSLLN